MRRRCDDGAQWHHGDDARQHDDGDDGGGSSSMTTAQQCSDSAQQRGARRDDDGATTTTTTHGDDDDSVQRRQGAWREGTARQRWRAWCDNDSARCDDDAQWHAAQWHTARTMTSSPHQANRQRPTASGPVPLLSVKLHRISRPIFSFSPQLGEQVTIQPNPLSSVPCLGEGNTFIFDSLIHF